MKYPPPEKLTLWERAQVWLIAGFFVLLLIGMLVGAFFLNSYRWGSCP